MKLVIDLETDDLLPSMTKIHVMGIYCIETDTATAYSDEPGQIPLAEGIEFIKKNCTLAIMHNGIGFDNEVLKRFYNLDLSDKIYDTFLMSQLYVPDENSHSLQAWGKRLGLDKIDYQGGFEKWTPEMQEYCLRDTKVTAKLYTNLMKLEKTPEAEKLEQELAPVCNHITKSGFYFDQAKAINLYSTFTATRKELGDELRQRFGIWYEDQGIFIPKVNRPKEGITKGVKYSKIKLIEFNPTSRAHIRNRLHKLYGWVATEFTDKGLPKLDDSILNKLPYPEAKALGNYMLISKRIGQLAEGQHAWLKLVEDDSRLHGRIKQNGTITGRSSHFYPNLAQVPSLNTLFGKECRELFSVPEGYKLIGCDAEGLELRCLAGYMANYDQGAYRHELLSGDIHTMNAELLGLDRAKAKTFVYAMIYGAGAEKLGLTVIGKRPSQECIQAGQIYREKLETGLPALKDLTDAVRAKFSKTGSLKGLDGRKITPRAEHAALNTLLQSAGAIIMKKAACLLFDRLNELGYINNGAVKIVAWVHDEFQIEARADLAEEVGTVAKNAIADAGKFFKFPCPMAGSYEIGNNWAETH